MVCDNNNTGHCAPLRFVPQGKRVRYNEGHDAADTSGSDYEG